MNKSNSITEGDQTKEQQSLSPLSWRLLIDKSIEESKDIRGYNYVQFATVDNESNEPRCRTVVCRGFLESFPLDHPHRLLCNEKSCVLQMSTNLYSNKVQKEQKQIDLASSSSLSPSPSSVVEIVWWFPKSLEQYRIRGDLILIGRNIEDNPQQTQNQKKDIRTNNNVQHYYDCNDHFLSQARIKLWEASTDASRETFYKTEIPGQPYDVNNTDNDNDSIPKGGKDESGNILPPPDTFLLMLIFPKHVDYLNLKKNYRQIDVSNKNYDENNCQSFSWSTQRSNL